MKLVRLTIGRRETKRWRFLNPVSSPVLDLADGKYPFTGRRTDTQSSRPSATLRRREYNSLMLFNRF